MKKDRATEGGTAATATAIVICRFQDDEGHHFHSSLTAKIGEIFAGAFAAPRVYRDSATPDQTSADVFDHARRLGEKHSSRVVVFGSISARGLFADVALVEPAMDYLGGEPAPRIDENVGDLLPVAEADLPFLARIVAGLAHFSGTDFAGAEACLSHLKPTAATPISASVQLILGSATLRHPKVWQGRGLATLRRALRGFEGVLKHRDAVMRSRGHRGLGFIHRQLADYEYPEAHLRKAVGEYLEALKALPTEANGRMRAEIETSLGVAYEHLAARIDRNEIRRHSLAAYAQPERVLQQAVKVHQDALGRLDTSDADDPLLRALVENNLGVARTQLAEFESAPENLAGAVAVLTAGLRRLPRSSHESSRATARALLLANLGEACRRYADHDHKARNLSDAEKHVRASLELVTQQDHPHVYAAAHLTLSRLLRAQRLPESIGSLATSLAVFDRLRLDRAREPATELCALEKQRGVEEFRKLLANAVSPPDWPFNDAGVLSAMKRWRSRE